MSSKAPKTKPDKAILDRLEAEGFIEWPEGPKPALRKPLMGIMEELDVMDPTKTKRPAVEPVRVKKSVGGQSIADFIAGQRR